jgi:hypothetical protein
MAPFSPLGRVVATPGALKLLEDAREKPLRYLARHVSGDWGDLEEGDRRENERSVKQAWRLLSLMVSTQAVHRG